MLRNKLLWRNEIYSKSSLKSQSLKQKVTNPQTQQRSFNWFVLFALLIWACVHSVSPPHPLVLAVPLNVPMPRLCGGTAHSLVAMAISNILSRLSELLICLKFASYLSSCSNEFYLNSIKNDGKTSTDLNSSHPLCVCMFVQKLGINMPVIAFYIVSALNNSAGLSLEIVIPQKHTCN